MRLRQPPPKTGARLAEFGEALTRLFVLLAAIVRRAMFGRHLTLPCYAARQHTMAGEFFQIQHVDDQFVLGHAQRQHMPHTPPTMAMKAKLRSQAEAIFRLEKTPTECK
jgi:hypothetical protein